MLWQANLALARGEDDAGLRLAGEALTRPLPPADREYALGLLAVTVPEAAGHFRQALALDRFHHRALGMLGLRLGVQGETGEARELAVLARRIYHEDPTFVVLQALLHARDGNVAAARAEAEAARGQLGERQFAVVRAVIGLVEVAPQLEQFVGHSSGVSQLLVLARLAPAAGRLSAAVAALGPGTGGAGGDMLLAPPALTRSLRQVGGVLRRSGLSALSRPTDDGIEELRQAAEVHPDGLLFYALGIAQANKGRLPEAEQAFRRAAEVFSIVPVRRSALWALMYCRWELFDREAEPVASAVASTAATSARADGLRRQALESVRGLLRYGGLRPDEADLAASVALAVGEIDLARSIVREWERGAGDGGLAPVRKRMVVEFRAGAYGAVLKATAIILGKLPGDERALEYREESVKRLRKQAEQYRPPGRD